MKPGLVEYVAPNSVEAVVDILASNDEAKVLAGGQSLIPLLNFRMGNPELLVDITRIPALAGITPRDHGTAIGAGVRQARVLADAGLRSRCPLIAGGLAHVGHPQIRSRGTVVGSLLHHDPAAELPAVAIALGARIVLQGPSGQRCVDAEDFFISHYVTAAGLDELALEAWFPDAPDGSGAGFAELSRRHGDFALVGAAAQLTLSGETVTDARIALSAVGEHAIRSRDAEAELIGGPITDPVVAAAGAAATHEPDIHPADDLHASSSYRRAMIPVVVARAVNQALEQARLRRTESERQGDL